MRLTTTINRIRLVGKAWMPMADMAADRDLTAYNMAQIEDPYDRDSVAHWVSLNCGDFSNMPDFHADFSLWNASTQTWDSVIHDWSDPESEFIYADCMFPPEDDE